MERFNLVFVYGTLKRGRYNCDRMKGVYLCDATTLQRFPLIVRYSLPYLLDLPNDGLNVEGELYGVTDDDLEYLDHLEGVPSHYQRKSVHVFTEENLYVAWSYFAVYPYDITNANLKSKY